MYLIDEFEELVEAGFELLTLELEVRHLINCTTGTVNHLGRK